MGSRQGSLAARDSGDDPLLVRLGDPDLVAQGLQQDELGTPVAAPLLRAAPEDLRLLGEDHAESDADGPPARPELSLVPLAGPLQDAEHAVVAQPLPQGQVDAQADPLNPGDGIPLPRLLAGGPDADHPGLAAARSFRSRAHPPRRQRGGLAEVGVAGAGHQGHRPLREASLQVRVHQPCDDVVVPHDLAVSEVGVEGPRARRDAAARRLEAVFCDDGALQLEADLLLPLELFDAVAGGVPAGVQLPLELFGREVLDQRVLHGKGVGQAQGRHAACKALELPGCKGGGVTPPLGCLDP
mmetsp:Transcript_98516/g.306763  ORF Transcript_98516/g.306763 Transcript_98516/m.306763 type:complete len:298 (+) Transcript_98516:519-1412(+)